MVKAVVKFPYARSSVWKYCNRPAEPTQVSKIVSDLKSHILKALYELLRGEWAKG